MCKKSIKPVFEKVIVEDKPVVQLELKLEFPETRSGLKFDGNVLK